MPSIFGEYDYLDLLQEILNNGEVREDRTGVGTKSIFGVSIYYDLKDKFPLFTSKRIYLPAVVHELIWLLSGSINIKYLQDNNIRIWNEWADKNGDLGPVYGYQWRYFPKMYNAGSQLLVDGYVDQIKELQDGLKNNPYSRRHILTAWNPGMIHDMALPPCHAFVQFYVHNDKTLDCILHQRSGDMFLGVPFNVASYSLLTHMLAKVCGLKPGRFIHNIGDAHIYTNHESQVMEQLDRSVPDHPKLLDLPMRDNVWEYTYEDIQFEGYNPHPTISAPVAV